MQSIARNRCSFRSVSAILRRSRGAADFPFSLFSCSAITPFAGDEATALIHPECIFIRDSRDRNLKAPARQVVAFVASHLHSASKICTPSVNRGCDPREEEPFFSYLKFRVTTVCKSLGAGVSELILPSRRSGIPKKRPGNSASLFCLFYVERQRERETRDDCI